MGKKNKNGSAKNSSKNEVAKESTTSSELQESNMSEKNSESNDHGLKKDGTPAKKRGPKPRTPEERAALKLQKQEAEEAKLARLEKRMAEQREKVLARAAKQEKRMKQTEVSAREAIGAVEVHVESAATAAMSSLRDGEVDFSAIADEPIFSYPWAALAAAYVSHNASLETALSEANKKGLTLPQLLVQYEVDNKIAKAASENAASEKSAEASGQEAAQLN